MGCPKPLLEPENEIAWELAVLMLNQARSGGMAGYLGFDYTALPVLFASLEIPQCEWIYYIQKLQAVQSVAVKHFNPET